MSSKTTGRRVDRVAHLQWVPLALMRVSPLAQRDLKQSRVDQLAADFDLDQIGILVMSKRDGVFWVIDGQHRKAALEAIGYGDQQVQCDVYEGLTEEEEAEMFLRRNNVLAVTAFARFRVGVTAGRPEETDIDRIVRAAGLKIAANNKTAGAIAAVSTLRSVYRRDGAAGLARTLVIIRDAYGDAGLEAAVIDGIGMLVHRYDGLLDDDAAIAKLRSAPGGIAGLTNSAHVTRMATGRPHAQCVAAAAVKLLNRGPGGRKLPPWFRAEAESNGGG